MRKNMKLGGEGGGENLRDLERARNVNKIYCTKIKIKLRKSKKKGGLKEQFRRKNKNKKGG